MKNSQYISLVLFLVAIVNLFYKQRVVDWIPEVGSTLTRTRPLTCPMQCEREPCDCETFCGSEYVAFRVMEGDSIYAMNQKLVANNLYCLPKGVGECDQSTSFQVYTTLAGWTCLPRAGLCKSTAALDNRLNVLWNVREDREADERELYERRDDLSSYDCKCNSLSVGGTPMMAAVRLNCLVDYCLRDIPNPLKSMGWKGDRCECAMFENADKGDAKSPCVPERVGVSGNLYTGRVNCMDETSFMKQALYCPKGADKMMFFNKIISDSVDEGVIVKAMLVTQKIP